MKSQTLKKDFIFLLIFSVGLFLLFLPKIQSNSWMFTDDGMFMEMLKEIRENFAEGNWAIISALFKEAGRFVPASMLIFLTRFELLGNQPESHYLLQFFVTLTLSISIFVILKIISKDFKSAAVGMTFFALFSANWENFFRLYPLEPFIALFLAFFAVLLVAMSSYQMNPKIEFVLKGVLILLFLFVLYIKEVAIAVLPAILLGAIFLNKFGKKLSLSEGRIKSLWNTTLLGVMGAAIVWYISRTFSGIQGVKSGWYADFYQISLTRMIISLGKYGDVFWNSGGPFLFIVLAAGLLFIWKEQKKNTSNDLLFWMGFFFIWGCGFLAILLPWRFATGRYILPVVWAFAIVVGLLWGRIFSKTFTDNPTRRFAVKAILIASLAIFVIVNLARVQHMIQWTLVRDNVNNSLLNQLEEIPDPESRKLWFIYPNPVETFSQIDALMKHTKGVTYADYGMLDRQKYQSNWKAGDLIIIPNQEGDGHFSCDGMYDPLYRDQFETELKKYCEFIGHFESTKNSTTIYLDSPIFNWIKKQNIPLPADVINQEKSRKLIDEQRLMKSWTIYIVDDKKLALNNPSQIE